MIMSRNIRIALFVAITTISTVLLICSCTEQQRTRSLGGISTVDLPACEKLVNATWKDNDFWYLYRPMRDGEKPETYQFRENSSFGVMQGAVNLRESCNK